ncbi:MAG: acylneuraminate cytidylyltransferase family protein [Planctomycetota bacterium]
MGGHDHATAVVLARAGSRGVPGKNVRPVAGKACIAWTIETALASRRVERVIVSSDDELALAAGERMGAEVHHRPQALASDHASVDAATRSAIKTLDAESAGPVALLYANVPVRPSDLIDRAIARLCETHADSVQSYVGVGKAHPWWQVRLDHVSGAVAPWEGDELFGGVYRRQDLPPAFVPDGGVLVVSRDALFHRVPGATEGPHRFQGVDRRGVTTRPGEVIDIDSEIDLRVAEAILAARAEDGRRVG